MKDTSSTDVERGSASEGSVGARLDPGDLKSALAMLRASGMPEEDVRALVDAWVNDRFKSRTDAVVASTVGRPFWETNQAGSEAMQRQREYMALWREMEELRESLGVSGQVDDPLMAFHLRGRFGPLPPERLLAVQRIERDYGDLMAQVRPSYLGGTMPWEREQLAFIEAEKARDLAATLSPEELETYQLHASPTASAMRRDLAGFAPTEEEFRAIFALQSAFDQKFNLGTAASTPAGYRASEEARPRLREELQATLGDERFKDYVRSTDRAYQAALGVTRRLGLPAANATEAYTLGQDFLTRAKALRNAGMGESERNAALGALFDEAKSRLDTLLTSAGAEAFIGRTEAASLIESIRRRP